MIIGIIIAIIAIVWLAYSIITVGFHIIKQGGKDARDMIGCFALPTGLFLIGILAGMCNNDNIEKETKQIEEKPIVSTVAKPKKERKKEPRDLRDGYCSTEGFKFGTNYDEAKRIVEKEVGEVYLGRDRHFISDKKFRAKLFNEIDSLHIIGIEFYFQNDELYGVKAELFIRGAREAEDYLTNRLGNPYKLDRKRIWVINKDNGVYYLSLYNEITHAEIYNEELDIREDAFIEYIKIK